MSYYAIAFLVSFQTLTYELTLFHILNYQFSYFYGVLGLSLALGGLGLGAAIAIPLCERSCDYAVCRAFTLFNLGLLAVPCMCLLPVPTWVSLVLLGLPYVPAGTLLSLVFATRSTPKLYACDMLGAALATATFSTLLPTFGLENLPVLLAGLGFAALVPLAGRGRFLVGGILLGVLSLGAVVANFQLEILNFAKLMPANHEFSWKIFNLPAEQKDVQFTRSDIVQRIEFVTAGKSVLHNEGLETYYDGLRVDVIRNSPGSILDVRLAGCLAIPDAKILVVGTAAQGVVKPAKLLGTTTGLEINHSTVALMQGPLFNFSRRAYENMELLMQDGRTFLESPGPQFDLITLLNTHTVHDIGEALSPDYLHTREGLEVALSRLTPRGFLSLEERNPSESSEKAIESLLATLQDTLSRTGRNPAAAHVVVYEWFGLMHKYVEEDRFLQILVRNQPFSETELEYLKTFERDPARLIPPGSPSNTVLPRLRLLYLPSGGAHPSQYADIVHAWPSELPSTTDDRPYPGAVKLQPVEWYKLIGLAVSLVLVGGLILGREAGRRDILCCILGGIASSLLQTILLQRLALITGSPGSALTVVLGGIFLAGGLGSHLLSGRRWSRLQRTGAVLLGGMALGLLLALPLQKVCPLSFPLRLLLVWLAIAPLAMTLGSFLPALALGSAESAQSARLFAVSALAGASATPMCLAVSLSWGHLCALLLAWGAALLACLLWPSFQGVPAGQENGSPPLAEGL